MMAWQYRFTAVHLRAEKCGEMDVVDEVVTKIPQVLYIWWQKFFSDFNWLIDPVAWFVSNGLLKIGTVRSQIQHQKVDRR